MSNKHKIPQETDTSSELGSVVNKGLGPAALGYFGARQGFDSGKIMDEGHVLRARTLHNHLSRVSEMDVIKGRAYLKKVLADDKYKSMGKEFQVGKIQSILDKRYNEIQDSIKNSPERKEISVIADKLKKVKQNIDLGAKKEGFFDVLKKGVSRAAISANNRKAESDGFRGTAAKWIAGATGTGGEAILPGKEEALRIRELKKKIVARNEIINQNFRKNDITGISKIIDKNLERINTNRLSGGKKALLFSAIGGLGAAGIGFGIDTAFRKMNHDENSMGLSAYLGAGGLMGRGLGGKTSTIKQKLLSNQAGKILDDSIISPTQKRQLIIPMFPGGLSSEHAAKELADLRDVVYSPHLSNIITSKRGTSELRRKLNIDSAAAGGGRGLYNLQGGVLGLAAGGGTGVISLPDYQTRVGLQKQSAVNNLPAPGLQNSTWNNTDKVIETGAVATGAGIGGILGNVYGNRKTLEMSPHFNSIQAVSSALKNSANSQPALAHKSILAGVQGAESSLDKFKSTKDILALPEFEAYKLSQQDYANKISSLDKYEKASSIRGILLDRESNLRRSISTITDPIEKAKMSTQLKRVENALKQGHLSGQEYQKNLLKEIEMGKRVDRSFHSIGEKGRVIADHIHSAAGTVGDEFRRIKPRMTLRGGAIGAGLGLAGAYMMHRDLNNSA